MNLANKSTYQHEGFGTLFVRSCFGKVIILFCAIGFILLAASVSVPSEKSMRSQMEDNIIQCIQANDSTNQDEIDNMVMNVHNIFTKADTTKAEQLRKTFYKYNHIEIYRHTFFATARIHNNFRPEGVRVGIGVFGTVIPTVYITDFLMHVGTVRKDYNQRLITPDYSTDDEYYGSNPDLKVSDNGGSNSNQISE